MIAKQPAKLASVGRLLSTMIGSNGVLCCQYALTVSAQSLTIMRLHVTIYSTNVDDDICGKAVLLGAAAERRGY